MPVRRALVAVAPPRLVVLRALRIGDLLTAVPALRALARAFPRHERILAAPAALRPLVELIEADGDGPAVHRLAPAGELEPLPRELHVPHMAVNLHGRGPQSHRILRRARPKRVLWFENPEVAESRGAPAWRPGEHEVDRWCRMLAENGVPADPAELDLRPPAGAAPAGTEGATLLHPGAASPARRWPPERFAEVARAEAERGRRVIVTGAPGEVALARRVAACAALPRARVLAGRTDLAELARAVAAAGRVVCGDSGVAHLATALGTPSVVLFGPTSPAEWGPPPERPWHHALWAGRTGDPHAGHPDEGLLEIQSADVVRALDELPEHVRG
ncbi:MAG: glycosyltransferase family 9 protein [Thermoleophilaceae bacterium]|nr:glycosyltransferase family 9 protein [Thermoleophilaceae bacterium]